MLYNLNNIMFKHGVKNIPNLEDEFKDTNNLSQMNVQNLALKYLQCLYDEGSDELVYNICKQEWDNVVNNKETSSESSDDDDDIQFESVSKNDIKNNCYYGPIDLSKIFTEQSYKYTGGCLIACKDPIKFALKYSKLLLKIVKRAGGLKSIIKRYENKMQSYSQELADIEKRISGKTVDSNGFSNKEGKINEEVSERGLKEPEFCLPSELQVNTYKHICTFNKKLVASKIVDKSSLRMPLVNLCYEFNVPSEIITLLCCGIGVYSLSLPDSFREYVLELTASGVLSFLIADDSISYGANYPFESVIILDELAKDHSINTLFQLMGRAGRVGCSWRSKVYFVGDGIQKRFINYLKGIVNNDIKIEADNFTYMFNIVTEEIENSKKIMEENKKQNIVNEKKVESQKIKVVKNSLDSLKNIRTKSPVFTKKNDSKSSDTNELYEVDILDNDDKSNSSSGWRNNNTITSVNSSRPQKSSQWRDNKNSDNKSSWGNENRDSTRRSSNDQSGWRRNNNDNRKSSNDRSEWSRNNRRSSDSKLGWNRNNSDSSRRSSNDNSGWRRDNGDSSRRSSNDNSGWRRDNGDSSRRSSNDNSGWRRDNGDSSRRSSNDNSGWRRNNDDNSRHSSNESGWRRSNRNDDSSSSNNQSGWRRNNQDDSSSLNNQSSWRINNKDDSTSSNNQSSWRNNNSSWKKDDKKKTSSSRVVFKNDNLSNSSNNKFKTK